MKILCVCVGNADRSPAMLAVLRRHLRDCEVSIESAGSLDEAVKKGKPAGDFARAECLNIGLDITDHKRKSLADLNLSDYDLFVVVDDFAVVNTLKAGVEAAKIYNVMVPDNGWPYKTAEQYRGTFRAILAVMPDVARYVRGLLAAE